MGLVVGSLLSEWLAIVTQRNYVMHCVMELKAFLMQSFFRRGLPAFHKESNSYHLNILSNDVDLVEIDYLLKKATATISGRTVFSRCGVVLSQLEGHPTLFSPVPAADFCAAASGPDSVKMESGPLRRQ